MKNIHMHRALLKLERKERKGKDKEELLCTEPQLKKGREKTRKNYSELQLTLQNSSSAVTDFSIVSIVSLSTFFAASNFPVKWEERRLCTTEFTCYEDTVVKTSETNTPNVMILTEYKWHKSFYYKVSVTSKFRNMHQFSLLLCCIIHVYCTLNS